MSDEPDDDDAAAPDGSEPQLPLAVDPKAQRRIRNSKKLAERAADEFWQGIFASETGRREMWRLLENMHPFETKFGASPAGLPDERQTWMLLAEQLLGQRIYQTWHTKFPEEIMLMLRENDPRFMKPRA